MNGCHPNECASENPDNTLIKVGINCIAWYFSILRTLRYVHAYDKASVRNDQFMEYPDFDSYFCEAYWGRISMDAGWYIHFSQTAKAMIMIFPVELAMSVMPKTAHCKGKNLLWTRVVSLSKNTKLPIVQEVF